MTTRIPKYGRLLGDFEVGGKRADAQTELI